MITRRHFFQSAAASGLLLRGRAGFAKASQPTAPLSFSIPQDACDCHTHIFGDPSKFPLSPSRVYTPETALPEEMSALHRALHIQRVVIVTPSVYGTNNSATLYGMSARGKNARGVAVIDDQTPESEIDAMDRAGVCGVRINSATAGVNDPDLVRHKFITTVERLKRRYWHVQLYTTLAVISAMQDVIRTSPVAVVFDHFGGARASLGLGQPGFTELVELIRSGKAYVKLSGAYRASTQAPDYPDAAPLARALIAANPGRILWGSDWPHPNTSAATDRKASGISPFLQVDDARLLNLLAVWAPDAEVRKKILVDNPARLYRF
jgi:predicted TIM-barrel fold metal-dependent hydrolase